jgi:hypothetical protein
VGGQEQGHHEHRDRPQLVQKVTKFFTVLIIPQVLFCLTSQIVASLSRWAVAPPYTKHRQAAKSLRSCLIGFVKKLAQPFIMF